MSEDSAAYNPPPHTGLDLLYVDADLLVVNKPAGLLTQPGRGEDKADCLLSRVQQEYPDALIVHRLDRDTSGLLVLGRGKQMHRELSILFAERKVKKRYIAVVAGKLEQEAGEINLPLALDWPNRPLHHVNHDMGKPSCTRYTVLGYDAAHNTTRVELEPVTGRSHQLRVHMQAIGHPIVGDELYAPEDIRQQAERLLLHAATLAFRHPHSGAELDFHSPAPF